MATAKRGRRPYQAGVIDVGAHSVRLDLFEVASDGRIELLESLSQSINLGYDVFRHGSVSPENLARLTSVMAAFARKLAEYRDPAYVKIRSSDRSAGLLLSLKCDRKNCFRIFCHRRKQRAYPYPENTPRTCNHNGRRYSADIPYAECTAEGQPKRRKSFVPASAGLLHYCRRKPDAYEIFHQPYRKINSRNKQHSRQKSTADSCIKTSKYFFHFIFYFLRFSFYSLTSVLFFNVTVFAGN